VLSESQQKDVWEGWLGGEIRSTYFADMAQRYQTRQTFLTWTTLLLSSGAAASLLSDWLPVELHWVRAVLAVLTAGVSFAMLLQQNQKRITECADLHFRWHRLASEYKGLWQDMYADTATARLRELEEREAELSKSSMSIPNRKRIMLKWQDYVEEQHGLQSVA